MGRLRFKRKTKLQLQQHGKMIILKNSESRCCQQQHQKQKRNQKQEQQQLPRIPYIRCGFLEGKTPKVLPSTDEQHRMPQSPVNSKAADISFPSSTSSSAAAASSRAVSVPVTTPAPKKWLTLGCDPCKQQRSLLHEDYKLQPRSAAAAAAASGNRSLQEDCRRKHRSSKSKPTVSSPPPAVPSVPDQARVSSAPSASPKRDWQQEMCWKVVARSENEVVRKQVVLQKASSSSARSSRNQDSSSRNHHRKFSDDFDAAAGAEGLISARNSCDSRLGSFKPGSEVAMYKLMTTSPDQNTENDSFYAWDKDLSPFASESSIFTSFNSPSNVFKSSSSKICASPENRRSRYIINSKTPSPGKDLRRSPQSQQQATDGLNWSASPPLLPGQFDEFQNDPEASSKSWERFGTSPLNIDEDTVGHHQSSRRYKSQYLCIQELESKHKRREEKKEEKQAFTSRVMESFAVEKTSANPYRDFRESMVEMILKKNLLQHSELEELLRSYLMLNSVEFHDLIVRVFTDLWNQLFCYDSS